jgi:hypothetical protein
MIIEEVHRFDVGLIRQISIHPQNTHGIRTEGVGIICSQQWQVPRFPHSIQLQ